MYEELDIMIRSKKHTAFLQNGFYTLSKQSPTFHNHNYTEIHIVFGANVDFAIGKMQYRADSGSLVVIPWGTYHSFTVNDCDPLHTAFQIDLDVNTFSAFSIHPATILDFFNEIELCRTTRDYTKVAAYISLFCSCFSSGDQLCVRSITNYGFLIHEFLSEHYQEDLHLCDLADFLHLSQRQTERLVIEHTGCTFQVALASMRISSAKQLLNTTDLSLSEVSRYVGYRSYSGFWKALQKFDQNAKLPRHSNP